MKEIKNKKRYKVNKRKSKNREGEMRDNIIDRKVR